MYAGFIDLNNLGGKAEKKEDTGSAVYIKPQNTAQMAPGMPQAQGSTGFQPMAHLNGKSLI